MHITEALGGGVFEVVNSLSGGLADEGHDVAIAYGVRAETPWPLRDAVDPRVELITTAWTQRTVRASLRASRQLRPAVRQWQPDVVHLHSSFAGVIGAATLKGLAPLVYTPHGYSFTMNSSPLRCRAFRTIERRVAHRVRVIGAVSDAEADLAREVISAPRVRVVHNGIPELNPHHTHQGTLKCGHGVVAMGRVVPQRQPRAVADIFSDLGGIAHTTWLGGAAFEDSPELRALAIAGVLVTGWLRRAEALERLAAATVYLHWTAWDGMPLSILEAMARDVVVIASDIPPNRDILGPRQVHKSEAQAARAIRRVLLDDAYRESLLQCQRVRRVRYGSTAMTHGWQQLYTTLIAEQKSRGHAANRSPYQQPHALPEPPQGGRVSRRTPQATGGLHRV